MSNDVLVEVSHLTKTFKGAPGPALNNVSLSLKRGEFAALIGPDGSGKTTFLRILSGLLLPDNISNSVEAPGGNGFGVVKIGGYSPVKDLDRIKGLIGYMPQKFGLYEDLTVAENIDLYAVLNDAGDDSKAEIQMLLEFAGLADFKKRLAGALSGGMKQKLGLCCTLLSKPVLLLLDEPSVGVDPLSRRELMKIVRKLVSENDIAVIWSTSYLDEAQNFERVFLFSEGEKIFDGNPKSVAGGRFEDFVIRKITENKGKENNEMLLKRLSKGALTIKVPEDGVTIRAVGLKKVYGNFTAADNISFEIRKGEIFGLLGPNGAGKSTTFKMLCGLIRPSAGYCSIMGVRMDENPVLARSYLGYMAQKFSLFGNLSVRQNLEFFAGVYGMCRMAKKRRVEEFLRLYDLKKFESQNAESLALGFKQRLALACAIVHTPAVLFLDEPTSGVDAVSRKEFWDEIKELARNGTTVLVTTHFMDEAQYCDRVSLIFKGKSLVTDTPDGLKNLARTESNANPTMEDAFIELISREGATQAEAKSE